MTRFCMIVAEFIVVFAFGCSSASATPVLWTLSGFTFNDGGTASGSFVYDADIDIFSNLNIQVTAGTAIGASTFQRVFQTHILFVNGFQTVDRNSGDLTGAHEFLIAAAAPFTNAGGVILRANTTIGEITCFDAVCSGGTNPFRGLLPGGTFTGTSVPEPNTLSLFILGTLSIWALRSGDSICRAGQIFAATGKRLRKLPIRNQDLA